MREHHRRRREMFVPLTHPPGHGQADFGEARVVIGGVARKAHFFVFDLPHSDACYVRAYPAATAEAWIDGHVHAFAFFGGVPQSVLYDNDRCLVSRILADGTRRRARLFNGFLSHYLVRDRYGRPGKVMPARVPVVSSAQRLSCLSMKVRSPMPCSCSCLSPTRSQRRRRELHGADSDMAQRLETAMAHKFASRQPC